jgi:hypothetical protein
MPAWIEGGSVRFALPGLRLAIRNADGFRLFQSDFSSKCTTNTAAGSGAQALQSITQQWRPASEQT